MLSFAELEFKWFFHVVGSVNQAGVDPGFSESGVRKFKEMGLECSPRIEAIGKHQNHTL